MVLSVLSTQFVSAMFSISAYRLLFLIFAHPSLSDTFKHACLKRSQLGNGSHL